ncbi:hypothetical protein IFM89_022140, partial [Coptis chinensis]
MVTSDDIEPIVLKLSSNKAKLREEGANLLNTWLEGDKSNEFCQFISQRTSKLKPNDIPNSKTWPFLIGLLTECVKSEISESKRRKPKEIYAKVFRNLIESGKMPVFVSVAKILFSHVWDVLKDATVFQFEYGKILQHLLEVKEYHVHMRKKLYCGFVLLHLGKVEASLSGTNSVQAKSKKELVNCISTLHSLLENPPGDFPDSIRKEIVEGLLAIWSLVSDEGNISHKLIKCINTYLLKDGPNLDREYLESIHSAVHGFAFRSWPKIQNLGLKPDVNSSVCPLGLFDGISVLPQHNVVGVGSVKDHLALWYMCSLFQRQSVADAVILYARLQLNLIRNAADGVHLVEQVLDVVCEELDQSNTTNTSITQGMTNSQIQLMELAAFVFFKACVNTTKAPSSEKRTKRENAVVRLRQGLMDGKWLWNSAFCFLVRNYHSRICKELLVYWFGGICESFESVSLDLKHVKADRVYSMFVILCYVWVILFADLERTYGVKRKHNIEGERQMDCKRLKEMQCVLMMAYYGSCGLGVEASQCLSVGMNELGSGWLTVWSSLVHALPIFSNVTAVADAALLLLANIISKELVNLPIVPQDIWELRLFMHMPSVSALYFLSCYFTRKGSQGDLREILYLRRNLLRAALGLLNGK